jgi:hypothetical protein
MPAIILLCRGLFGKNVWTLNFRHNPLSNPPTPRNKVTPLFLNSKKTEFSISRYMIEMKTRRVFHHQ